MPGKKRSSLFIAGIASSHDGKRKEREKRSRWRVKELHFY